MIETGFLAESLGELLGVEMGPRVSSCTVAAVGVSIVERREHRFVRFDRGTTNETAVSLCYRVGSSAIVVGRRFVVWYDTARTAVDAESDIQRACVCFAWCRKELGWI